MNINRGIAPHANFGCYDPREDTVATWDDLGAGLDRLLSFTGSIGVVDITKQQNYVKQAFSNVLPFLQECSMTEMNLRTAPFFQTLRKV